MTFDEFFADTIKDALKSELEDQLASLEQRLISEIRALEKPIYTRREFAKLLDSTERRVGYLQSKREIEYVKIGRRVYFTATAVREFFNSRTVTKGEKQISGSQPVKDAR